MLQDAHVSVMCLGSLCDVGVHVLVASTQALKQSSAASVCDTLSQQRRDSWGDLASGREFSERKRARDIDSVVRSAVGQFQDKELLCRHSLTPATCHRKGNGKDRITEQKGMA